MPAEAWVALAALALGVIGTLWRLGVQVGRLLGRIDAIETSVAELHAKMDGKGLTILHGERARR